MLNGQATVEQFEWPEWAQDGESWWLNNEDNRPDNPGYGSGFLAGDNATLGHVVMLYKNFDDGYASYIFYGPAAYLNPINQLPGQADYPDYISTGAKSADMINLFRIPELANAAQIDGKVFTEYTEIGIEAKNAAEAEELRILDIFGVENEESILSEEEADLAVKEAEEEIEEEFEQYPEIILEGFEDNELPGEESAETEVETPAMDEPEADEFDSYPEIQYPEFDEPESEPEPEADEEPDAVEEKSVPTPAVPEKKEQKDGFSLFHF